MAFGCNLKNFFPGINDPGWFFEMKNCQCQQTLYGDVQPPPESSSGRTLNDPHPIQWQGESRSHLLLIIVDVLSRADDCDSSFFIQVGNTGIWSQIGGAN